MNPICPRHGTVLLQNLVGIPFCQDCRKRDRSEIDDLIAAGVQLARATHQRLVILADVSSKAEPAGAR